MEPQLRRSRADHGGGIAGSGSARGVLRIGGRAAGHGAKPHAAAHVAGGDGSAGAVRRHVGAQREDQSAAIDPPIHRGNGLEFRGARAIRAGDGGRQAGARIPAGTGREARFGRPRHSWR